MAALAGYPVIAPAILAAVPERMAATARAIHAAVGLGQIASTRRVLNLMAQAGLIAAGRARVRHGGEAAVYRRFGFCPPH